MANELELEGAYKRTKEGHVDYYYGGGDPAWASLAAAYDGIPEAVREGKTFAVWDGNQVVEYIWHENVQKGDEVLKNSGGSASIDDLNVAPDTTYSSEKIVHELDLKVDVDGTKVLSDVNYSFTDKSKVDSLSVIFLGYFDTTSDLNTAHPTGELGQHAIVGSDRYIWSSGSGAWIVDPDAIGDTFSSDLTVRGTSFGKYNDGETIPSAGKTASEVITLAAVNQVPPTYTAPTASVSLDQISTTLEIGETVDVTIDPAFTQNDGGTSTGVEIFKDGISIGTLDPTEDLSVIVSATDIEYYAEYDYNQGAVKNDNLGDPYPTGQIAAGTVASSSATLRGYLKIFYGHNSADVTTSPTARGLPQSRFVHEALTFTLNTQTSNYMLLFIPEAYTLQSVVDLDALSKVITSEYDLVNDTFTINDPSGGVHIYKKYMKYNSVAYTSNHRHQVTIG